jgi:hypothetical protein
MMQQRGSPNRQIRVRAKIHLHANTTLGKIPYGVLLGKIRLRRRAAQKTLCVPEPILRLKVPGNPIINLYNAGAGEGI